MSADAVDGAATVVVAPRELHDLTYRCARVAGCDPGTANRLARNLVATEIHHGQAVEAFVSVMARGPDAIRSTALAADVIGDVDLSVRRQSGERDVRFRAHRDGLSIESTAFEALKLAAHQFLVTEAVLDGR